MTKEKLDWAIVYKRLESFATTLDESTDPPISVKTQILHDRALLLARKDTAIARSDPSFEVMEFLLGDERYGVESRFVQEVQNLKDFTPVPCTPPFVLGVINLRGRILSVIDLRIFFNIPLKGVSALAKVIVLKHDSIEVGILGDEIRGVKTVFSNDLQPSLPTITGIGEEFLTGISDDRLIVLDSEKILTHKRIIVNDGD